MKETENILGEIGEKSWASKSVNWKVGKYEGDAQ